MTDSFYEKLIPVEGFSRIVDPSIYTALPNDWLVAVSDVKNSTGMIEQGGYKKVNLIGASTIMAILNLKKSFSLPFIFGGDGAAVCIPQSMEEEARRALFATRKMAQELYDIELRIGIVPISYIREQGYDVLVVPCKLSKAFSQAAFTGGGLQFAEDCLKNPSTAQNFSINLQNENVQADFSGLECRWENVPSARGEIVSLIVQALGTSLEERSRTYREAIKQVEMIYGDDVQCHPVQEKLLRMSLREKYLFGESDIRSYAKGTFERVKYWFTIRWNVLLGKFLLWSSFKTKNLDWGTYKKRLTENTDFKKFDDKFRQLLSGSIEQRKQLQRYLEEKFVARKLVYGMHAAPSALITCLLFDYNNEHIHLVDSDNGGYAVAAKQLKEKILQAQK